MMTKIECAQCKAEGTAYELSWGGVTPQTCMAFRPFVDDERRRHYHDSNTGGNEVWLCSNGHRVSEPEGPSCWCGWPISGAWAEADKRAREEQEAKRAARG